MTIVQGIECGGATRQFSGVVLNQVRTTQAWAVSGGRTMILYENDESLLAANEGYRVAIETSSDGGNNWVYASGSDFFGGWVNPRPGTYPNRGGRFSIPPGVTHVRAVGTPLSQSPTIGILFGAI